MSLCECHECLCIRNGGALRLVELERENTKLKKAHAWFVSRSDCECIEGGCPVDGELHSGGYDDDDLSWRHAQGCEWIKARDLTL